MTQVAVLFARADSIYKRLDGCDVWDEDRDARRWPGGAPIVAHPPCRLWSRMREFSNAPADEAKLALLAVDWVRRWGGVLEHPSASKLWQAAGLPSPASPARDEWGGWSLPVSQKWWGHRAEKRTWLYIVGCQPGQLPPMPLVLGPASRTLGLWSGRDRKTARPEVTKPERDATPPEFAIWLRDLAQKCAVSIDR